MNQTFQRSNENTCDPTKLARWELRAGQYRIFYDVMLEDTVVSILAVGYKDGNRLYIRGTEYTL